MEHGESFREFYDRALPVVYGYFFRRCGGRSDVAEELTQETFVSAVRSLKLGPQVSAPLPWVVSIARRRLVDFYRGESRRQTLGQRLRGQVEIDTPRSATTTVAEVRLLTALENLLEMQRLALVLRYVDDLPVREVAELIDRSERATESLLGRARRSLMEAYQEVEDG